MNEKTCCRCGVLKPYEAFWFDKSSSTGREHACKDCRNQRRNTKEKRKTELKKVAREMAKKHAKYNPKAKFERKAFAFYSILNSINY